MTSSDSDHCSAFVGDRCVATGTRIEVARAARYALEESPGATVLVFDASARPVELDLRGTVEEVVRRLESTAPGQATPAAAQGGRRGPGRPRLGVVSREVTLLPRHWAWLATHRGGASAALRRLIDQARKADIRGARARAAQDATYRFSAAMAGNQPGFEESMRALFAGDAEKFSEHTRDWPPDVRDHARTLAVAALTDTSSAAPADEDE